MIKDDYMDSEEGYRVSSTRRSDSRSSDDRSEGTRPAYRGRRSEQRDDQPASSRRRRRIGEMRPEGSDTGGTRRPDRGGAGRRLSYLSGDDDYDRQRPSFRTEREQEDRPDYKERYMQKVESNRHRYDREQSTTEDGPEDAYRPRTSRRPMDDRSDYREEEERPSYSRRTRSYDGPSRREGGRSYSSRAGSSNYNNKRHRFGNYSNYPRQGSQRQRPGSRKQAQPTYDLPEIDQDEPIRLNKFIANAGVCSRREADDLITAGAVLVNGVPVTTLGTKVTMNDRVEVNRQEVKPERKVYVLLNKPRNCVTTSDDPQERMTVVNLVRSAAKERIYPVGRLDRNTTGVLLLTNDGELAAKLVHPSFEKKKIYHAWLDREVSPEDMQKLADGIELEDGEMHADAISYVTDEDHTQVGIEIHSGRNRIVRRLFEALGYRVVKLDRVYFAGLTKKNLGRGKWRYLTQEEVNNLKMGAFE